MQKILFPLQSNDKGPEVKNLHGAILAINEKLKAGYFRDLFKVRDFSETFEHEWKDEVYGEATVQIISAFQEQYLKATPSGMVDKATAGALNSLLEQYKLIEAPPVAAPVYAVQGSVYDEWQGPVAHSLVKVCLLTIRDERLLAEAKTDEDGAFKITYEGKKISEADKKSGPDLKVSVYGDDGALLYPAQVFYNAPSTLKVSGFGAAPAGKSEFATAVSQILPYIHDLHIASLEENTRVHDLSYLVSKTGISVTVLLQLVVAYRFEPLMDIDAETIYGILSQMTNTFTGVDGNGTALPIDLDVAVQQVYANFWGNTVSGMMAGFQNAYQNNTIIFRLGADTDKIQAQLQKLSVAPPQMSGVTVQLPPIYAQTTLAGLTTAQQQAVQENYTPGTVNAAFWTTLASDPSFSNESDQGVSAINQLKVVFQLSGWTMDNTSLVGYIMAQNKIAQPADLQNLVSLNLTGWEDLITASGAAPASNVSPDAVKNLAANLAANVESLYPTQVLANRVSAAANLFPANRSVILNVLQDPDFNIVNTPVRSYLKTYFTSVKVPDGVDTNALTYQLLGTQRVYKMVQSSDTAVSLLSSGIQSARQIYAMGRTNFVNQFQGVLGGADSAAGTYERAAVMHTGSAYALGSVISILNNHPGNFMPDYGAQLPASSFAANYPDLANLFRTAATYCECKDCESFLGIPAYLTDILDFLYQRKTTDSTTAPANARAVLLANNYTLNNLQYRRRPDIGDIDLSCKNTNVELPYIDIVNELLEDYIIPPIAAVQITVSELIISPILAPGKINPSLYQQLMTGLNLPGVPPPISNISLLTPDAVVSNYFTTDDENLPVWMKETTANPVTQWIIRDKYITLKVYYAPDAAVQQYFTPVTAGKFPIVRNPNQIPEYENPVIDYQVSNAEMNPVGEGTIVTENQLVQENGPGGDFHFNPNSYFTTSTLIVQEIHQTHLSAAEISANPEYTNTNVYNCLSDPFNKYNNNYWELYSTAGGGMIPFSLPFDLYFTEANMYLEKMGKKRYDLLNTYRKNTLHPLTPATPFSGDSKSIKQIAWAYFDLSPAEAEIIFYASSNPAQFWSAAVYAINSDVEAFLSATNLTFSQLQTLLTLKFINPKGDSSIIDNPTIPITTVSEACNTADMVITNMSGKFDPINRFLRLWNQLNTLTTISMEELDDCIMSSAMGNGSLDKYCSVSLYYFMQLMSQMNLTATQALALYQAIGSTGKNSLYSQLFLNRQISNPLVASFTLPIAGGITITGNIPIIQVILTACGITQTDLNFILTLNNGVYNNLSVPTLSFIYACGALSGTLSCSVSDLVTFSNITGIIPLQQFNTIINNITGNTATPRDTFNFIIKFNEVQQAGFTVDELNYLLTNTSNATPSLIPNANAVVTGLQNIRTAIQGAVAATTVIADPHGTLLKTWLADPELGWDKNVADQLLAILSTNGTAGYIPQVQNNLRFLQLLQTQYSISSATAFLERMPSISFDTAATNLSTISNINYDGSAYYLFYYGTMSPSISTYLQSLSGADTTAIAQLFTQSQCCPVSAVACTVPVGDPPAASIPAWITGNITSIQQNAAGFSCGQGVLSFKGAMPAAVYTALFAQSTDTTYGCALTQLFIATQSPATGPITYVQLAALPAIALPDNNVISFTYNTNGSLIDGPVLSFEGAMTAADCRALLGLSTDTNFQNAICQLFTSSQSGHTVTTSLDTLPAGWLGLPDLTSLAGLVFSPGMLQYYGPMTAVTQNNLISDASADGSFINAVNILFGLSQPGVSVSTPLNALPAGFTISASATPGLTFVPPALCLSGQLTPAVQQALNNLNPDNTDWLNAITSLLAMAPVTGTTTVTVTLPANGSINAASFSPYVPFGVTFTPAPSSTVPATLSCTGPMTPYIFDLLSGLSNDAGWTASITLLNQNSQASCVSAVLFTLPPGLTQASFAGIDTSLTCSTPDSNGNTTLSCTGQMSGALQQKLLALDISQNPVYAAAVNYLYNQTSAIIPFTLPAISIPLPDALLGNITYSQGAIVFAGTPNPDSMDSFNLSGLGIDEGYVDAINFIYTPAAPGTIGVSLAALPPIALPPPITNIAYANGVLSVTGQLQASDYLALQQLSADASYQAALLSFMPAIPFITPSQLQHFGVTVTAIAGTQNYTLTYTGIMPTDIQASLLALSSEANYSAAINSLYTQSQTASTPVVSAPVALPAAAGTADMLSLGVAAEQYQLGAVAGLALSYNGVMDAATTLKNLLLLSADPTYQNAIYALYNQSQNTVVQSAPLAALPPVAIPAGIGFAFDPENAILYYNGSAANYTTAVTTIQKLSSENDFSGAVKILSGASVNTATIQVFAPAPQTSFIDAGFSLTSGSITYVNGTLGVTGVLCFEDYTALLSLSSDTNYQSAVNNLFTTPANPFIFSLPKITIPGIYAGQFSYSQATNTLTLAGYIAPADQAALLSLSTETHYLQAINSLFNTVNCQDNPGANTFQSLYEALLPTQYGALTTPAPAGMYAYFLNAISPLYKTAKTHDAIAAQLAATFGITVAVATVLVKELTSLTNNSNTIPTTLPGLYASMTTGSFAGNTRAINPDPVQCQQACWYMQLARIAYVVNQYNTSAADVCWLLKNGGANSTAVNAINLFMYPNAANPLTFAEWEVFNGLRVFQNNYIPVALPDPANPAKTISLSVYAVIDALFAITNGLGKIPVVPPNPGDVIMKLARLTGWDITELQYLLNMNQDNQPGLISNPLQLTDSGVPALGCIQDLTDISILQRLSDCFAIANRLKITPARCAAWVSNPVTENIATDIKHALKAIYPDSASWTSAIVPLTNTLRQNRRDAVLAYLLSNPVTNPFSQGTASGTFGVFPDIYSVYGNFLLDIEMAACQPTTRVIQAYCSVQLFAQRCFLGIETNINTNSDKNTGGDAEWLQWTMWMSTFESWYEARNIFLFPENFILPQTLPNASSLFQDIQNDLAQGPVTTDIVGTAFSNYIEGLDEIGRLEIRGMWYDHPSTTLHVFARTYGGDPSIYYYRTLDVNGVWSVWSQVTADIAGDQIIPVVQNGRIYLYWPIFAQTSDDDKSSQTVPGVGGSIPPPNKYWKIQMAFSEYRNGQWSGKKVSTDFLSTGLIAVTPGSPIIYPDTFDFVFIALDIPQAAADPMTGTINSLDNNGTMAIACYQNIPGAQTLSIKVTYTSTTDPSQQNNNTLTQGPVTVGPYTIPFDIQQQSFKMSDLMTQFDKDSKTNEQSNKTVFLNKPDIKTAEKTVANILTGLDSSWSPVTISISGPTSAKGSSNSDTLTILDPPSPFNLNAFLLDPLRGYTTAIDIKTIVNADKPFKHLWFDNSSFTDNLVQGSTPLNAMPSTPHNGNSILAHKNQSYTSLLSLQMGIWASFQYLDQNKNFDPNYLGIMMPFFFQDSSSTFFINQLTVPLPNDLTYTRVVNILKNPATFGFDIGVLFQSATMDSGPNYEFINFYHPFVSYFLKIIAAPQNGIAAVLDRAIQLTGDATYGANTEVKNNLINQSAYKSFDFYNRFSPSGNVIIDYPIEQMDFSIPYTSYSQYNWELFFHSVLMSAMQLSQNQQFEDADTWFKFIFNPTDSTDHTLPHKFWETKPFFKNSNVDQSIDDLIINYESTPTDQDNFWKSASLWPNDPYDPHMLAQYRVTPYMYTTIMKYLDNLIAWANYNYTQYTMESVNIAVQLYMLAQEILGPKPVAIPLVVKNPLNTYYQLETQLDQAIANADGFLSDPIVEMENLLAPPPATGFSIPGRAKKIPTLSGLYFCIPQNTVLLAYWDTVATNLYQINNCMNIEGQFDPLSPFPSIPGLNGMDGFGISDFGGVIPNYRFSIMIQKAAELCNEVRSLGGALLSALEKNDAEGLAMLHATQEIAVQNDIDKVKQLQITDAQLSLENLQNYQTLVNDKISYYKGLISGGLIPLEQQALALNQSSLALEDQIGAASAIATLYGGFPNFSFGIAGVGGTPEVSTSLGGQQLGAAANSYVQLLSTQAHFDDKSAAINTTNAAYQRRTTEWQFQLTLAQDELAQVNAQIQAATNKIAIATQDEQNQQVLIQNAEDVQSFLQNKYTNQQLYSWMVTQISNVYFQSYQLAYSIAKQAEICFRYEMCMTNTSYINYGYWDSLHKGLLSGEALMSNIRQMETDYLAFDNREYELTRQVSLAQLDPVALLQLKSNGACYINIPEELFDLDYPGHYFRRIKHVAITLPGVVGPYTPVCLKMTLLKNSVRIVGDTSGATKANTYPRNVDSTGAPTNDSRFLDNVAAMQFIATSNGVNDNGLFEMNLHDERYLPFERAGAISSWQLELPSVYPQFDPGSITDLIIHFSYTSRDGGAAFGAIVQQSIQKKLGSAMSAPGIVLMRAFSARRDFPTQWYKFLNPPTLGDSQQLLMDITQRFPFFTNGHTVKINQVSLVADIPASNVNAANTLSSLYLSGPVLTSALLDFGQNGEFGPDYYASLRCKDKPGQWQITNGTGAGVPAVIDSSDINDISVIFYYSLISTNS